MRVIRKYGLWIVICTLACVIGAGAVSGLRAVRPARAKRSWVPRSFRCGESECFGSSNRAQGAEQR